MGTAVQAPDINGFPLGDSERTGRAVAKIVTYRVPGTPVALPVCSDVAPLLLGLAADFHRDVEPLDVGSCWGYAYRPVRGGSTPSFHSAGIAIDLNAPRHPLGRRGTFTSTQAARCRELAREYGCRWGGDYVRRPDEMHFEVILRRPDALALVRERVAYPLPLDHMFREDPGGRPEWHDGRDGQDRPAIRRVQRVVGSAPDGIYGSRTTATVRAWQQTHGLVADGTVGRLTWGATQAATRGATQGTTSAATQGGAR